MSLSKTSILAMFIVALVGPYAAFGQFSATFTLTGDAQDPANVFPLTPLAITVTDTQTYGTNYWNNDISRLQLNWSNSSPGLSLATGAAWTWGAPVLGLVAPPPHLTINDTDLSDGLVNIQNSAVITIAPASPFSVGTLTLAAPTYNPGGGNTYTLNLAGGSYDDETLTAVIDVMPINPGDPDGVLLAPPNGTGLTLSTYTFTVIPGGKWTGGSSTAWQAPGNWSSATAPGPTFTAVFDGPPVSNQPALGQSESVNSLLFKTGGWTISQTDTQTLTVETGNITSAGAAGTTNTIAPEIHIGAGATAATFTVNGDDTTHNLQLLAALTLPGKTVNKEGYGTLTTAAITAGTVNHNGGILNAASVTSTNFNVYSTAVVTGAVNASGNTMVSTTGSLTAASHTGGSLGVYGSANYGTGSVSLTGAAAVGNGADAATLSAGTVIADSLTILDKGKVTTVGGKTRTSVLGSLVFGNTVDDPSGKLDLVDGLLAINYTGASPLTAIQKAIIAAFNGGDWAGNGITSSLLIANPTGKYGIGYVENILLPVPFDSSKPFGDYASAGDKTVLVRYTLIGDMNLDGIINDADISLVTNNIGQIGGGWLGGDVFGYDNIVNDSDISLTTNNIGQSVGQLTGGISELSAVPEPATLSLLALGGLALLSRRRK